MPTFDQQREPGPNGLNGAYGGQVGLGAPTNSQTVFRGPNGRPATVVRPVNGRAPTVLRTPNGQQQQLSIAIVDCREAIHAAVELWCLRAQPRILVAGQYFTAESFLAAHPWARESSPGVVVLDVELESRRVDFAVLDSLVERGHRVVVYSHIEDHEVVLNCRDHGAVGYIAKSESNRHLMDAIRAAHAGHPYMGPLMASATRTANEAGRPHLAPREKEVLLQWFRTDSKDLVALELNIAPSTVRTVLQRIRAKYAAVGRPATTKAALVARAIQDRIIDVGSL